ncbi:hypothetical protein SFC79_00305 [Nocardioides sp. S-58]|uniref:Uncharacterized protein n=1 Tax=Nocardioides renjunii TaxID=3095075 RepID=A0ABU5K5L0_9ACTN|nr:hypothetical protein [Nocardioides sp. S-58]MDZ5660191.1 hypothetical protein [Nocardioides sp. S-58]
MEAVTIYLVVIGIVSLAAVALAAAALTTTLRETRSDRRARHESIPTYYGRMIHAS